MVSIILYWNHNFDKSNFYRGERPDRSGREVSGHVRGAPPGSRSSASGYGSREGERGVMGERGGGGQVSNSLFMHEAGRNWEIKNHAGKISWPHSIR